MTIYGKGIGNVTGLAYMPGNRRASLPDDGRMPGSRPLPANHVGYIEQIGGLQWKPISCIMKTSFCSYFK